jgi:hypothetical protein
MTVDAIRKQLAELAKLEADAARAVKEMEASVAEDKADGLALINEITTYFHGCKTRRPGFTFSEAQARELTKAFAQKLLDEPYVIVPMNYDPKARSGGNEPGHGITVEGRKHVLLLDQYRAVYEAARQARQNFAGEHAAVLREADEREENERFHEVMQTGTREEIAQALAALPTVQPTAFTTEDLA